MPSSYGFILHAVCTVFSSLRINKKRSGADKSSVFGRLWKGQLISVPRQQQSFCRLVIQVATLPASKLHALMFSLLPGRLVQQSWCRVYTEILTKIHGRALNVTQRLKAASGAVRVMLLWGSGNKTSMRPLTWNQSCTTGSTRHLAYSSLDGS